MVENNTKISFTRYSPKEVDRRFNKLLNELKSEKDVTRINKQIAQLFGGFSLFTIEFNFEKDGLKIYRVTKEYPSLKDKKHLPSSFLNPPLDKTNLGRANLEKHPVFYGSIFPHTAIEESNLSVGETFYLSEWILPLNTKVRAFVLAFDSKERKGFLDYYIDDALNKMLSNSSEDEKHWFKYTQKKIIDLFTYEGSQYYNISSAIAHQYLYLYRDKIVETPIIMYPSVTKTGDEYNFAIHPDFVSNEEKFRLVSVLKCQSGTSDKKPIIHEKGVKGINGIIWNK